MPNGITFTYPVFLGYIKKSRKGVPAVLLSKLEDIKNLDINLEDMTKIGGDRFGNKSTPTVSGFFMNRINKRLRNYVENGYEIRREKN